MQVGLGVERIDGGRGFRQLQMFADHLPPPVFHLPAEVELALGEVDAVVRFDFDFLLQSEVLDQFLAGAAQQSRQARGGGAGTDEARDHKRGAVPRGNPRLRGSLMPVLGDFDLRNFAVLFDPVSQDRALAAARRAGEDELAGYRTSGSRNQKRGASWG